MRVEIAVLGPVEIRVAGVGVDPGSPQQAMLLALLAVRDGDRVSVEHIVDTMWPEDPPHSARKIVQTYVSRLRRLVGDDVLVSRNGGYALVGADVDATRFQELVREGRGARALALWRGRPLVDAERYEELRLQALEQRADEAIDGGRSGDVIGELRGALADNPWREQLVERFMLALYATGRQAEALDVYTTMRRRLSDELGIEPSERLKELERRILAHDPSLPRERRSARVLQRFGRKRRVAVVTLVSLVAVGAMATFAFPGSHSPRVVVRPNSIVRIDPKTNAVVDSIPVGRDPSGIIASKDAVWVSNERDRTLTYVDVHDRKTRTIGGVSGVGFLARDVAGNVYASGWDYPWVWRIDPSRLTIAERFRVRSHATAIAIGGGSLWAVDRLVNGVTRIDLARPSSLGFVHVGSDPIVSVFAYGALWVANSDDGTVSVIRPGVAKPQTIAVSSKPYGIASGEGAIWVGSFEDSTVTRIDPETRRVTKVISVSKDGGQTGLYNVSAGAGGVWAANAFDLNVVRIDPATDRVVARIYLGETPRWISTDGNDVWVSLAPRGHYG